MSQTVQIFTSTHSTTTSNIIGNQNKFVTLPQKLAKICQIFTVQIYDENKNKANENKVAYYQYVIRFVSFHQVSLFVVYRFFFGTFLFLICFLFSTFFVPLQKQHK